MFVLFNREPWHVNLRPLDAGVSRCCLRFRHRFRVYGVDYGEGVPQPMNTNMSNGGQPTFEFSNLRRHSSTTRAKQLPPIFRKNQKALQINCRTRKFAVLLEVVTNEVWSSFFGKSRLHILLECVILRHYKFNNYNRIKNFPRLLPRAKINYHKLFYVYIMYRNL